MKRLRLISVILAAVILSGCNSLNLANMQNSIVPPNMSKEQNAIYKVIKQTAGEQIKLKYPTAGDMRSAIAMQDFDNDGTDEAVAFYQSTAVNGSPHVFIKVLKGSSEQWSLVADVEGDGNDIERVVFGRSSENNERFMAVGYDVANKMDKIFRVYSYNGGRVTAEVSMNYSMLETFDIDEDGNDEIIFINSSQNANKYQTDFNFAGNESYVSMMRRIGGRFTIVSKARMSLEVYDYAMIGKGITKDGHPALYIDGQKDANIYITEILRENKGKIVNLIYNEKNNLIKQTERENTAIADVNGDEVYDIPQAYTMGADSRIVNQQRLTDWYDYENGKLIKVMSSYVNNLDGYIFSFPVEWEYKVGVSKNISTNEITFCSYKEKNSQTNVLLKIRTKKRNENVDIKDGKYDFIKSNGHLSYYAYIPEEVQENLEITVKEIKSNLIIR